MPRTFSRGKKIIADTCWEFISRLSDSEDTDFVAQARLRYCPDAPLIEQDIWDGLDKLRTGLRKYALHLEVDHEGMFPGDLFHIVTDLEPIEAELEDVTRRLRAFQNQPIV